MPRATAFLLLMTLVLATSAAAQPAGWADYTVTFDATWSAETHPTMFPPDAHWSGLIGGTHNASVAFWTPGQLASVGIKQMAEWGSQPALAAEVQAAIDAGDGGAVVSGPVLWDSPVQTQIGLQVTPDHPLVTLVAMLAPSPDWFAGVRGLDLRDGDNWVEELVVDLYPYDAGTDSGASFASGDVVTNPAQPIAAIPGAPFTPGVPVATLIFTLVAAADVPDAVSRSFRAVPNPFNPRTELRFTVPEGVAARLALHDVRGRLVRHLDVPAGAGDKSIAWDGRDDAGALAPSGMYFARLDLGAMSVVRKLTLTK